MEKNSNSILDRALFDLLKPNWEKGFYLLVSVLAVASRFWDLGARAMSFDECTHALYSYNLYSGSGFSHDPLMHGPFLFHANALVYFLFGDNDYTARIVPALFGVFMVLSPLLLRRWLGRAGAMVASLLLLISPSLLFYSRYIRNEIYIAVWMVVLTAALFHFLAGRKPAWFYAGATVLMLSLATKENAYFFGYMGLVYLVALVLWERVRPGRRARLYLAGFALSLFLLSVATLLGRQPVEGVEPAAAGDLLGLIRALATVVGGTLPLLLISTSLIPSRYPLPSRLAEALRALSWRNWLVAGVLMLLVYVLLFTTFFTSPGGLWSGIFGSLSYWLAQQAVERGGQPWFYYPLLLLMYEFLPLLLGLAGLIYYLLRGQPSALAQGLGPAPDTVLESEPAPVLNPEPDPELDPEPGLVEACAPTSLNSLFVSFLIFWTLFSLFIYAWAGEKMPWMVVHQVLPLILLGAKFAGDLLEQVNWRAIVRRGGVQLALLLLLLFFAFYGLSRVPGVGQRLAVLGLILLLLALGFILVRRLGVRRSLLVAASSLLAILLFFTLRFAWMAAYTNYDYATELLVYAHGGADVKPTMDEIAAISERIAGDKTIEVAYDQEAAWPLEWYMREYPNRVFYGTRPTRSVLDAPVVLASIDIDDKVRPYLGDRYHRSRRRQLWWPSQEYMGLTLERIADILATPEKRAALWQILYNREYPRSPDDWYHVDYMYLYVRKDVAHRLWDYGSVPPELFEEWRDPYAGVQVDLAADQVWGSGAGAAPGQFNRPRGLAVGPGGQVFVVDSDNARVQVFDASGAFLRQWGSYCNLENGQGCLDPDGDGPLAWGDGQFREPWGIAVSHDGRVYVADTWNHRLQVFDAQGASLAKWGAFGETVSASGLFYGPRGVALDGQGRVYVTDTGNERVVVFDASGNYLNQWGGEGLGPGQFAEPVGIDLDPEGNIYVADTWNLRVQAFDQQGSFVREWPVDAWYGQGVANKPFLAVDGWGRVYVTDPEGYRVIVFDDQGELLASWGDYGFDDQAFGLPTGIGLAMDGAIYVTDSDGQRVLRFPSLP